MTCMLGDVWCFIFPFSSPLGASVPSLHLHARCSSFVRKDRRCPDLDAESSTGCWGSLGANSSPVRRHANLPNVQVPRDQIFWGFLSGRGHHVPAPTWEGCRATLQTLLLRLFLPVGGCRSSGWALVLLAFVFLFSWRWCSSLVWGFEFSFFVHAGHGADCLSGSFRVLIATGSSLKLRGTFFTCRARVGQRSP